MQSNQRNREKYVKQNIKVGEKEKKKLAKYKKVILGLGKKQKTAKRVKSLVQQTGTGIFLPIVLPLVAAAIGNLLKE